MVCIHIVDNLLSPLRAKQTIEPYIAGQIAGLIYENTINANINNTYSKKELAHLLSNKNEKTILERLDEGFLVYLTDKASMIVGCGMLVRSDGRYFAKTLHIESSYRGMGYGHLICSIRENALLATGVNELYIESLKFPGTIDFHRSRDFIESPPYRELFYSILMRKNLNTKGGNR